MELKRWGIRISFIFYVFFFYAIYKYVYKLSMHNAMKPRGAYKVYVKDPNYLKDT